MIQIALNFFVFFSILSFIGCSTHYKKRQQQRDKVAATSGLFCEFVSGDEFTDVDVEVNLRMAKKCDLEKPLTMTNYRNSSDNFGLVYCCQVAKGKIEKSKTDELAPLSGTASISNESSSAKPMSPAIKKRTLKKTKTKADKSASTPPSSASTSDASSSGPTVESSSAPPAPSETPAATPAETGTTAPGGQ